MYLNLRSIMFRHNNWIWYIENLEILLILAKFFMILNC